MTARQVFFGMLVELNKVQAPSLLLEDFNYLFNKAIRQYINKRYNIYDMNQQTSDDLRVLKSTAMLTPRLSTAYNGSQLFGATYEVDLPSDYLHILNCICNFKVLKQFDCYNANTDVQFAGIRLTADLWSQIINNYYMRPTYKRPYFYIHNVNTNVELPTNPYVSATGNGTDMNGVYNVTSSEGGVGQISNLPRTIKISGRDESVVERNIANRFGNASKVRMELRYGKDNTVFELTSVLIDYLKTPQNIRLTQEQLDLTEDTSQIMEFPDYVCQEIINELTAIVLENSMDPRIQTQPVVSQSVANPAQATDNSK